MRLFGLENYGCLRLSRVYKFLSKNIAKQRGALDQVVSE